ADKIFVGVQTSADSVFVMRKLEQGDREVVVYSKALEKQYRIESEILLPLLKGNEIHRYRFTDAANLILFQYRVENGKVRLIAQAELERSFPLGWQYLNDAYGILGSRENGKWASSEWWQFGRNQNIEEMLLPKIVNQVLSKKSSFAYDIQGRYCFVG